VGQAFLPLLFSLFFIRSRRPLAKNSGRPIRRAKRKGVGGKEFLPARAFSFCRAKRDNQSEFRSKKVRASFSNCDQVRHCEFCGQFVGSLAPPSAGAEFIPQRRDSHFSVYFSTKSNGRTKSKISFLSSRRRFGVRSTLSRKCGISNFFRVSR